MTRAAPYPPQTGAYVVKVKSSQSNAHWRDFDTAHLQISIGQAYHEDEKLRATINWAAARFKRIRLCVNDTLQRFNDMYEQGYCDHTARQVSRDRGQAWIERYIPLLAGVPHLQITRWDTMLNDPDFRYMRHLVHRFHQDNAEFRDCVEASVRTIWARRFRPDSHSPQAAAADFSRFAGFSREYLLEEIAVFSMMCNRERAIDIYPGSLGREMTVFYNRHVEGIPPGMNKRAFCRIDFTRNKNPDDNVLSLHIA